jgi:nucleoid DNA-binding protein
MDEFEGFQSMEEYLSSKGDGFPVSIPELDHIVDEVISHTSVTREQAVRIISLLFQEIRSSILQGDIIDLKVLGRFSISSPVTTGNKNTFIKFKPKKSLIRKINEDK